VLIEQGASSNTIGGVAGTMGNIISGNSDSGVEITGTGTSNNEVMGNDIGTDKTGTFAVSNGAGVFINNASSNLIGGADHTLGNVISGNTSYGLEILGISSTANIVEGNNIGADSSGTQAVLRSTDPDPTISHQAFGVLISDSVGNTIGSQTSSWSNLISGNAVGIQIAGFNSTLTGFNTLIGNYVGVGINQTPVANVIGIWVNDVPNNQIGAPGTGNTIAGNTEAGVYINGADATGNKVQGNVIGPGGQPGLVIAGQGAAEQPFPIGVYIQDSSSNLIGGRGAQGNTISGNNVGVYIFGHSGSASGNNIEHNQIKNNSRYGVILFNAPANNAPQSGPVANTISGSGIANYREFSGPVATSGSSHSTRSSSSSHRGKKAAPQHTSVSKHKAVKKTSHPLKPVHGRSVPAGPLGKVHARFRR
jgi:titin